MRSLFLPITAASRRDLVERIVQLVIGLFLYGVALGLMLHAHVDAVPAAITVSCAILGLTLVVTRDGWLSLFMAAVVVPDSTLLPLLCIVMLPAWLLLAGKPLMIAKRPND